MKHPQHRLPLAVRVAAIFTIHALLVPLNIRDLKGFG
jgi:hypothetical protein